MTVGNSHITSTDPQMLNGQGILVLTVKLAASALSVVKVVRSIGFLKRCEASGADELHLLFLKDGGKVLALK